MLQNWLKPLPSTILDAIESLPEYALGRNLVLFREEMPDLKKVRVALVGADESAHAIRKYLYPLIGAQVGQTIADLGNLRKKDAAQLIPVVYELLSGGILPVVLAADHHLARAQFLAYQEAKALANWVTIDERLRLGDDVLDAVLKPRHPLLFHFGVIGLQSHFMPPTHQKLLDKFHFDAVRLGRSRMAIEETEPMLRDADLLTLHLSALKMAEAPGVSTPTPSGYLLEEACQLSRYAGMSDKLTSFGVYGYDLQHDSRGQTAQAAAQLIWYFLDGVFNRVGDFPASVKSLTEYVVDYPAYNYQLTFWKSARSGRWWLQAPIDTKRKQQRHRLIACSFQDYQSACRGELPERLLQAFKRF